MAGVGFIGLGNQGGPIAHRIVDAGLPLLVWARRPEVAQPYAAKGARVAATIAELGAACRHVGICVLDDAAVIQVCAALIPPMPAGGLIAVHSTILPQTAEDLARDRVAFPAFYGEDLLLPPGKTPAYLGQAVALLVEAVILLRNSLACLPSIADSMAWVESDLLQVGMIG